MRPTPAASPEADADTLTLGGHGIVELPVKPVAGVLAAAYWWREARQRRLRPLLAVDPAPDEPALVESRP